MRSSTLIGSLAAVAWGMLGFAPTAWADTSPVVPSPVVLPWGPAPVQTAVATPVAQPALPDLGPKGDSIAADAARKATGMIGVPYSWGGGTIAGTSYGVKQGAGTDGFDCSGLVTWAYSAAGLDWVKLDPAHINKFGRLDAQMIFAVSQPLGKNPANFRPGDPLFFGTARDIHHIGIYLGRQHGRYVMVDAPHTGASVRIERFLNWPDFYGAGRLPGSWESAGTVVSAGDLVLPWGGHHPKPKPDNRPVPDIVPPPIRQQHVHKPPAAQPVVPAGPPSPDQPAVPVTPTTPVKPADAAVPTVVTPWGSSADTSSQPDAIVPAVPADIQTAPPVALPVAGSSDTFSQQVWQDDIDRMRQAGIIPIIRQAVQDHLVPLGYDQEQGEAVEEGVISEETHARNEIGDGGHGRGYGQVDDRTVPEEILAQHNEGLDPQWNIDRSAAILAGKIQYFLDQGYGTDDALHYGIAAYNAGQGAVGSVLPGDPDRVTANGHYSAYVLGAARYYLSLK